MRHSAIMGVIAVACVVAVVDSAMLGPTGRLHHGGGLGRANERNTRVMGMGFIDDESDEAPPLFQLAQLALASGGLVGPPGTVSDTSDDKSFSPPAAPTGFAGPAFSLGGLAAPPRAGAPPPPPGPPAPPAAPPDAPPKAAPLTPISLLKPSTDPPPVTPDPPVTPPPPIEPPVTPPVVVPVIFNPPPPIEPPQPSFVASVPIAAAPLALPEPATWAMMLLGCGLAAMALRRRRARLGAVPV